MLIGVSLCKHVMYLAIVMCPFPGEMLFF